MPSKPLFTLGNIVSTPAALRLLVLNGVEPHQLLTRHVTGDWGDLDGWDQAANKHAVENGLRVFSSYRLTPTERVWVITEADRSVTAFLRPEEY